MSLLARHLLARATACQLAALIGLWPFLLLASFDNALIRSNPLLAVKPLLALAIALVVSAPVVLPLAAGLGTVLYLVRTEEQGEAVLAELAGRSPTWVALPALIPAAVLSAAGALLLVGPHPRALAALRGTAWVSAENLPAVLERMAEVPRYGHLAYGGRDIGGGMVGDLRLLLAGQGEEPLALVAREACLSREAQGALRIELREGDLAGPWQIGGVDQLRFEEAELQAELDALVRRGVRAWSRPSTRSLPELLGDAHFARLVAGEEAEQLARRYAFEPWYRLILAGLPLLLAAQLARVWIGAPRLERGPGRALGILLVVSFALLQLTGFARGVAPSNLAAALALLAVALPVPIILARGLLLGLRLVR